MKVGNTVRLTRSWTEGGYTIPRGTEGVCDNIVLGDHIHVFFPEFKSELPYGIFFSWPWVMKAAVRTVHEANKLY